MIGGTTIDAIADRTSYLCFSVPSGPGPRAKVLGPFSSVRVSVKAISATGAKLQDRVRVATQIPDDAAWELEGVPGVVWREVTVFSSPSPNAAAAVEAAFEAARVPAEQTKEFE